MKAKLSSFFSSSEQVWMHAFKNKFLKTCFEKYVFENMF